jgi:hypothetical protein
MEINIVELIVQAGALGLTALLLFGLWKYGAAFVSRLMDNLDLQSKNHEATILVQAEVATTLASLRDDLMSGQEESDRQGDQSDEVVKVLENVCEQLQAHGKQIQEHEGRAQERHQQQMGHSAERHAELIGVLRHLNGKS